jgi:hypothetical protein
MTALFPIVKPVSQMQLAPGSAVTIPNVNWQEFESILAELGEKRAARLAYSQGTLEIRVPLPEHEKPQDIISDIVKRDRKMDVGEAGRFKPQLHKLNPPARVSQIPFARVCLRFLRSVLSCYAAEYGNYYLVSDAIAFPALILIPHRNSRKFQ